jgi:transcriptional regulator with XRE-family HTH domain
MRPRDTVGAVPASRSLPAREPAPIAFGLAVRWYREERGWSQETLAFRCGLHPTYVGPIERGEKSPTITTVFKLSAGLEVRPAQLVEAAERFLDGGP